VQAVCDTIYEAESTYILSDFKNALIYNDYCAVRRVSIVAPLQQLLLSNSADNSPPGPTVCILRPRILYRVSRINDFKEGLTIKRDQNANKIKRTVKSWILMCLRRLKKVIIGGVIYNI